MYPPPLAKKKDLLRFSLMLGAKGQFWHSENFSGFLFPSKSEVEGHEAAWLPELEVASGLAYLIGWDWPDFHEFH